MKNKFILAFVILITICFVNINSATAQTNSKDTTITLEVTGITCAGDLPVICKRVQTEKGINKIMAISKAGATTRFQVTYNPTLINYNQLVSSVQDAPSCDYPDERPYKVKNKKKN